MNVNPFSRGTKRPWASIGLAGFLASKDRDAAALLSATHLQQVESRTPKAEAGFRSSDNRRGGKGRVMRVIRVLGDNDLVERFQSSNHMGCSKRPPYVDGRPTKQLSGFMESIV